MDAPHPPRLGSWGRGLKMEQIRHGTFGPIVWDTDTGATRVATQDDMDSLPVGPDLTAEEEDSIGE
jgi:hypothetical protein